MSCNAISHLGNVMSVKCPSMKCCVYEMSFLWNIESMKCTLKCPFFDISCPCNIMPMKCPVFEISCLWNILSIKYPVYEMSYLWDNLSVKCLHKKSCLWKVLSLKYSVYSISFISEMSCLLNFPSRKCLI